MRRQREKAASMLEFTFVAIPIIFVMISIFEIARGMWLFNSLSHGVKEATRFAIVHGNNCATLPNNCTKTTAQICQVLEDAAVGLEPARIQTVRMTSFSRTLPPFSDLTACKSDATIFPSKTPGATVQDPGGMQGQPIEISAVYQFDSALTFYWTGSRGFTFGRIYLPASSKDYVQY